MIWIAGPLKLLPFEIAYWAWFGVLFAALVYLTGRWALAWLLFLPVTSELFHGNVHLLLAAALVAGFRIPALWAFLPLAKVTTGLVLLWPLVRRQWRRLTIAAVTLALLSVGSAIVTPAAWPDWIARLLEPNDGRLDAGGAAAIAVPLVPRLLAAGAITIWAARSGRRWPLAIALVLSLPQLWFHGLSILAAIPRLRASEAPPAAGLAAPRSMT